MQDGDLVTDGQPNEIMTVDLLHAVFGIRAEIIADVGTGRPLILPALAHADDCLESAPA
jgi:iron complex transport system ATP-binding protein